MCILARACFLIFLTIANCATGAEAELYSREFLRTLIVWGYKAQSSRMLGTEGSPLMRESIDKAWSAVLGTPEAKFAETPKLASLFASDVPDKSAAVAAWHALRLADCPSYTVVLDRRKILGFTEEWSVIIGEGNLQREVVDGDSIISCDRLITGGYSNVTVVNQKPIQYSVSENVFICTRAYLFAVRQYGQVFAEYGKVSIPTTDLDGINYSDPEPWRSLCKGLYQGSWRDEGGKPAWQIGYSSDRRRLHDRATGVQVKGLQLLGRGYSSVNAMVVSGFSENFESIFLYSRHPNVRVGFASMIDMAIASQSDIWQEYLREVVSVARRRAAATNEAFVPLVYLSSCNEGDLRGILNDAMISQFEGIIKYRSSQIFEGSEDLGEQQFIECTESLVAMLPGRALPYLFWTQYHARKQDWKKASEVLVRGLDRVDSGRELGRLKFAQFRMAGQDPGLKPYTDEEAVARLTEIVELDGVSIGPSLRLTRLHSQLGRPAQALEILQKLRERVAVEDLPEVDKMINEVKAVL